MLVTTVAVSLHILFRRRQVYAKCTPRRRFYFMATSPYAKPIKKWAAQPARMHVLHFLRAARPSSKARVVRKARRLLPWANLFSHARPMGRLLCIWASDSHWANILAVRCPRMFRKLPETPLVWLYLRTESINWSNFNHFITIWWIFRRRTAKKRDGFACFS